MIHFILREPIAYQRTLCQALSDYYRGDFVAWFISGAETDFGASDKFQRHFLRATGFTELFKALRADHAPILVLASWSSSFAYRVLLMAATLRVPIFIWADHPHPRDRGLLFERARRAYLLLLGRAVAGFLACGSPTVEYLAALGMPRDKIFNFPYWVRVPENWSMAAGCDETSVDQPLRLLAIGRLVSAKKFEVAIAAVALANQRAGRVVAELLLIGDGPERSLLEKAVNAEGLGPSVTFAGRLDNDEVFERLNSADVLIVTSKFEGYGVVVLEALAHGRPVLASDKTIAAQDKANGSPAILFHSVGDVDQLAKQIEQLSRDRIAFADMCRAARSIAEDCKLEKAGETLQRIFEVRLPHRPSQSVPLTVAPASPLALAEKAPPETAALRSNAQ